MIPVLDDVSGLYYALKQLFEADMSLWDKAIGTERILIQTEEHQAGIRLDVPTRSVDFPISIREGRISAVFLFEGDSLKSFIKGVSLATLKDQGLLRCTGKSIAIFEAAFFLDFLAHAVSEYSPDESQYLH